MITWIGIVIDAIKLLIALFGALGALVAVIKSTFHKTPSPPPTTPIAVPPTVTPVSQSAPVKHKEAQVVNNLKAVVDAELEQHHAVKAECQRLSCIAHLDVAPLRVDPILEDEIEIDPLTLQPCPGSKYTVRDRKLFESILIYGEIK